MYLKDCVIRTGAIFALVMLIMFLSARVQGQQTLSFGWDPSTDTNVIGYLIEYGTMSGVYPSEIDVGSNTTVTLSNFDMGDTYYITVIAYDSAGLQSPPSGELVVAIPGRVFISPGVNPGDPVRVTFPVGPGHWYELQVTSDLANWQTIYQTGMEDGFFTEEYDDPLSVAYPQRYYRLILH